MVPFVYYPLGKRLGCVRDRSTGTEYFYHAHKHPTEAEDMPGEHGHFHLLWRPEQSVAPAEIRPVHLVAIRMNDQGVPIALFTVPYLWAAAAPTAKLLDTFLLSPGGSYSIVRRFLGNMVCLFRPQIERLLVERDTLIARWCKKQPDRDPRLNPIAYLEAGGLEAICQVKIDLDEQIQQVSLPDRRKGQRGRRKRHPN
jgi:hypothetical protein